MKILIYINSEKHIELGNKNSNINSGKIFNFGWYELWKSMYG